MKYKVNTANSSDGYLYGFIDTTPLMDIPYRTVLLSILLAMKEKYLLTAFFCSKKNI